MRIRLDVVSHSKEQLESVTDNASINKVLLSDLPIPTEFKGEDLAESRYLLTRNLIGVDYDMVGFVSARWSERFPLWPDLTNLADLLIRQPAGDFRQVVVAPNILRLAKFQIQPWIQAQDSVHPGMGKLLKELIEFKQIDLSENRLYSLVMGNNFVLTSNYIDEFLDFWQECFEFLHQNYGLDFPYSYRCHTCGFVSEEKIGRWSRIRHAGFLMERVTALFFISNPELRPLSIKQGRFFEPRWIMVSKSFGIGFRLSSLKSKLRLEKPCVHSAD